MFGFALSCGRLVTAALTGWYPVVVSCCDRLGGTIRDGIYVPYAVPAVVATLMWGYLYGPDFGPFAQLADLLSSL